MQTLLIMLSNEDFQLALESVLKEEYRVLSASDTDQGLALARQEKPELLALDAILPGLDGLSFVEALYDSGIYPRILLFSRYFSQYTYDAAQRLDISYLMLRPCPVSAAAARLRDISRTSGLPSHAVQTLVRDTLLKLPFSSGCDGFGYLMEALPRMIQDPKLQITKSLYPDVAKICGCNSRDVERNIRSALESMWKHPEDPFLRAHFPDYSARPSNKVFLTRMALLLRKDLE